MDERLFIWPTHNVAGHDPTGREEPLTGLFAVKLGRGHLERALSVRNVDGMWFVALDGFLLATPSDDWKSAFGSLWERGQEHGNGLLIGRRLSRDQFLALAKAREADAEKGIDLDAAADPNAITPPNFQRTQP